MSTQNKMRASVPTSTPRRAVTQEMLRMIQQHLERDREIDDLQRKVIKLLKSGAQVESGLLQAIVMLHGTEEESKIRRSIPVSEQLMIVERTSRSRSSDRAMARNDD